MKYNQPYGITDENAPYINGNPSTGTMGSIPPAASIEHPQREIVAAISRALKQDLSGPQFAPSDGDLEQLAKVIQSSLLATARDTGTANAYACNLSPSPGSYFEGLEVTLKIANANTGPSVLNINALGNKEIVHPDGTPLSSNILRPGTYVKFKYDGTKFHLVWFSTVQGMPVFLTSNKTFYVNAATGNDAYDGTAATFSVGVTGPFQTLQRAANEIKKFNLNNFNVTVIVADGTYASVSLPKYSGSGAVYWRGNIANPAGCLINAGPNANCVDGADVGDHWLEGFKVTAPGPASGSTCSGMFFGGNTHIFIGAIDWGFCSGSHLIVSRSAQCTLTQSAFKISGSAQGNASAPSAHAWVFFGGNLECNNSALPNLTITTAVNIGSFIQAGALGVTSYLFSSFTGAANVTGKKYAADTNAIINTLGSGVSYYPGTIAGTTATGGQYV